MSAIRFHKADGQVLVCEDVEVGSPGPGQAEFVTKLLG